MDFTATLAREFERETNRIDQLVWDTLAIASGDAVLFCGIANDREWIERAAALGAAVTVVSDDPVALRAIRDLPVTALRGSTSMLPAGDGSYDVAIAFHYLHEVDPLFHPNIVAELARVGKRCVIVEPAPPSDPLGTRIAALYARCKREFGEFETYHPAEYWRKLVAAVKPGVTVQSFAFLRTPPPLAVRGTVDLIIDTMAAEATPESYLAELRALAARPDAVLVPQARNVIVGVARDAISIAAVKSEFRDRGTIEARTAQAVRPFVPPSFTRYDSSAAAAPTTPAAPSAALAANAPQDAAKLAARTTSPRPSLPGEAARTSGARAPEPPASPGGAPTIARNAFGLGTAPAPPLGEAEDLAEDADDGFGWAWEAPAD